MQTTRIENRIGVGASPEHIWDLIADLPGWHRWNPYETDVSGTIAFGGRLTLTERFPEQPERAVTGLVGDWQPSTKLVWTEKRGWAFSLIRYFEIETLAPENCIVANGVIYSGLRGEMFHDRHRNALRPTFLAINEGLKALAEC